MTRNLWAIPNALDLSDVQMSQLLTDAGTTTIVLTLVNLSFPTREHGVR
jgi:hypothetical protein